ncbi:S24 family peptidase [Mucilaginibacter lappiensis]|uniref:Signal peptidase I n=1 Tax=Mucilaginibacter lappiensis TaxID=354630 RepID=A0A841JIK9_9SPHI|nr:S24/S26 family peptidase [Mucilaginibacter lappiensis]MBB6130777.1 signal peptidase I [Mucilaginibacter lappiensis]
MSSNSNQGFNRVVRINNSDFFNHLKTYLDEGKKIVFTVSGNSMYPFIKNGDKVLLKSIELDDIKKGRIVLACTNGQFFLHRIVAIHASKIILAGDGNLVQHEVVEIKEIWAIAVEVIYRNWVRNVQSPSLIFFSRVWYRIRPIRLLIFKLRSLLRIK